MITLRNIHQIETTSVCNLKCEYCIHPLLKREKKHMSMATFKRALEWVLFLRSKRGDKQTEIGLTGVGEPFLNPRLPDMIAAARKACPEALITVSTNGTKITKALCERIKPHDPTIMLSLHGAATDEKAQKLLDDADLLAVMNDRMHTTSFDWAGQVDWPVGAGPMQCFYLATGSGVVLADGEIVRCCLDGHGLGVIGDVKDKPAEGVKMPPFKLCKSCHMEVPDG